jgi:hypothetical protein
MPALGQEEEALKMLGASAGAQQGKIASPRAKT